MGVSRHIGKKFHHRIVWNGDGTFKNSYDQEFQASKSTYMSWYATAKAFANVQNGRTYAQVVSQKPKHVGGELLTEIT